MSAPATRLWLPAGVRARLGEEAVAGYPLEVCGVLIGRCAGDTTDVREALRLPNAVTERAHDRYAFDPRDLLAAQRHAGEQELDVVGIWHTHPDHPARPSETDRAAAWEGWSYVIVAVRREGVQELRSWRLHAGRFHEEGIADHAQDRDSHPGAAALPHGRQ